MNSEAVKNLINGITGRVTSRQAIRAELGRISQVTAWLEHTSMMLRKQLDALAATDPSLLLDSEYANAARSNVRNAKRTAARNETGDHFPFVATGLAHGTITVDHLDAITAATKTLTDKQKEAIGDHHEQLAQIASKVGPPEFVRILNQFVHEVLSEADGIERLRQQKASIRLKHWIDQTTGMWHLHGIFDPESGSRLEARIAAETESQFRRGATVSGAPTNLSDRQAFLRATALAVLVYPPSNMTDANSTRARPEICIVIDEQTLAIGRRHNQSVVTSNNGAEYAVTTIQRMACDANMIPIVIDTKGIVLSAGRQHRLANTEQRRALRAQYHSCAIAECDVRFDYCEPHHITFWRNGGHTDLNNLVPLCSKHHHAAHEGQWHLALDGDRSLTVTLPNGTRFVSPMKIRKGILRGPDPPPKAA